MRVSGLRDYHHLSYGSVHDDSDDDDESWELVNTRGFGFEKGGL